MKQKKNKITIITVWILLCGWMMCMSSCGSLLYNPSNKAEQVTVTIKQPIRLPLMLLWIIVTSY